MDILFKPLSSSCKFLRNDILHDKFSFHLMPVFVMELRLGVLLGFCKLSVVVTEPFGDFLGLLIRCAVVYTVCSVRKVTYRNKQAGPCESKMFCCQMLSTAWFISYKTQI